MKILLSFLFCLLSLGAFSQVKLGIQLGYNRAGFYKRDQSFVDYYRTTSSINALNAGLVTSIPLGKKIYLQPSLLLNEKGAHKKEGGGENAGFIYFHSETNIRLWYAEVPVNIVYSIFNSNKWHVLAGVGAYVSQGLWGKETGFAGSYDSLGMPGAAAINKKVNFTKNISAYNPYRTNIKPMDAGFNIVTEIGWKSIYLKASCSYGLTKVMEPDFKNRVFSLSANYFLNKKRR